MTRTALFSNQLTECTKYFSLQRKWLGVFFGIHQ